LAGEVIDDNPYALWSLETIAEHRVTEAPELVMIGVAIDPPAYSTEGSDECGIVAGGVDKRGHGYVLHSEELQAHPSKWGSQGVRLYYTLHADRIIAETNQGGEMVEHTIHTVDDRVPYKGRHVHRGKRLRAEPVAALYDQGKIHHVGVHSELEDEMCDWVPGDRSPNLMDALTLLFTDLILEGGRRFRPV
jgi:phage terminase large subunit-like protein